jgi:hypothetical protein
MGCRRSGFEPPGSIGTGPLLARLAFVEGCRRSGFEPPGSIGTGPLLARLAFVVVRPIKRLVVMPQNFLG